jgi:hypothetical protein
MVTHPRSPVDTKKVRTGVYAGRPAGRHAMQSRTCSRFVYARAPTSHQPPTDPSIKFQCQYICRGFRTLAFVLPVHNSEVRLVWWALPPCMATDPGELNMTRDALPLSWGEGRIKKHTTTKNSHWYRSNITSLFIPNVVYIRNYNLMTHRE